MELSNKLRTRVYIRWLLMRLALMLFDIFAVNFSYFIALVIRFYANNEFAAYALRYLPAFKTFAPWYTVACLLVFGAFRLYNNRWKYVGLNDMNRILLACIVTCVVQVVGSVAFVLRMPITYYAIGAVIQFCLVTFARFSYRLYLLERNRLRKSSSSIRVMIVGVGETSHMVRRHMEQDDNKAARPVCVVDYRAEELCDLLEGLPVISGVSKVAEAIKKYRVECVILADGTMPKETRDTIKDICAQQNVEVQNFTGFFAESRGAVSLRNLMEYTKGKVELVFNETSVTFANGEQAVMSISNNFVVRSISAKENHLVVELQQDVLVRNDVHEEWVQTYEQQTGEDISFF